MKKPLFLYLFSYIIENIITNKTIIRLLTVVYNINSNKHKVNGEHIYFQLH